uniref:Uncharacterized protein n=1 Tax=Rhizophora mucronata TaxID=61149 RepID=A0A2P2PXF9_RHIMU
MIAQFINVYHRHTIM